MRTDRKKLAVFADRANFQTTVPLPTLADVLYAKPSPDGSRKQCANCMMWMPEGRQCAIMASSYLVPGDAICGYHVFGVPKDHERAAGMVPIDPAMSGFEQVRGGTSCDNCAQYDSKGSTCHAVVGADGSGNARVAARGCCTRWRARA